MTRGQLRTYARRQLAEKVPAESFWDDEDLNDFLDRGHEQVVSMGQPVRCDCHGRMFKNQQALTMHLFQAAKKAATEAMAG